MIDGFFNRWYTTWAFAIGGTKGSNSQIPALHNLANFGALDNSIPPYVEILVTHTRLSIYSSVFNHPTAPIEVKRFFRSSGLSSSLSVLRAAVQGESRLKSMPNNTCIMISFAACFAIYLSTKGQLSLASSVSILIEESAGVLERIGRATGHRNGTSALYGRHLREVVNSAMSRGSQSQQNLAEQSNQFQIQRQVYQSPMEVPATPVQMTELLQFSAMSDDQINEAINNAGEGLGINIPNFQMDDRTWLDWFNLDVSY